MDDCVGSKGISLFFSLSFKICTRYRYRYQVPGQVPGTSTGTGTVRLNKGTRTTVYQYNSTGSATVHSDLDVKKTPS